MLIDLAVIGAGPAGLMCAIRTAAAGLSVVVLEKNSSAGRKLRVSGSGKCNLSNASSLDVFTAAYGEHGRFARPSLLNFPNTALGAFFSSLGLELVELHDGKLFPVSMRSSDVLKVLLDACKKNKADIRYGQSVRGIGREGDVFSVTTDKERLLSRCVLVATGGVSWPETGSTGDGYAFASFFGHRIIPPRPALAAVTVKAYDCAGCAGIALENVRVGIWSGGRKAGEKTGDMLFTHEGLSGPVILDQSRRIECGDEISISLVDFQDTDTALLAACGASRRKTVKSIVCGFGLSDPLCRIVLQRSGIDPAISGAELDRKSRRACSAMLDDFRFSVKCLEGLDRSMATAGGVDTKEVNSRTMESKHLTGLFFAGEVLDVDGETGGYNLQFAFSSGVLAADAVIKKLSH